jgi:2-polyprenyl-3-methyl-5-hydroxy-6-metoxy-1,4-benzoquinol methylase
MPSIEEGCRLCGSTHTRRLFTKGQTPYWECADCGFRFATPHTNPNFVTAIGDYEAAYLQYLGPDESDEANQSSLYDWMQRITPLEGRRLLDIGAGSGKLVRFLRARRVEAHGIEPSRALFDRFLATEEAFTCAMLDQYRSAGAAPFDIVTAFDVIEHVPDPVAFLGDVAALVEPGGMFFASTPDAGSVPARAFGRWWHFYYPYHLSYFAPRSLARAAEPHGLHIVDCRHRGRVRSAGYMIRYAAEFIAGVKPPRWARWFDRQYVAINLFDTMYVAFSTSPSSVQQRTSET